MTHTPGPWRAQAPLYKGAPWYVKAGSIAIISTKTEGDAFLIAAAPDLLAALEDAEFLLRKAGQIAGPMQDSFNRSAADARAAIAKATNPKEQ